ncbi:MAG TPA: hypothetical protein VIH37_03120 [Candidatus Limnocylindrales bacterium]
MLYHPEIAYQLAKQKREEDAQFAERERLIREAGKTRPSGAIDAVRFRDRVQRLFGSMLASGGGSAPARV